MEDYKISINQLVSFKGASDAKKLSIVRNQKKPITFMVARYRTASSCMKKCIEQKGNLKPVLDGLKRLAIKECKTDWNKNDTKHSIEALELFKKLKLPDILNEIDFDVEKTKVKTTIISDVKVIISPDIIIKGELKGKKVMGGFKFHISKSNQFDLDKSKLTASTIVHYLKEEVADEHTEVLPELCFSIDIFAERIVSAKEVSKDLKYEIITFCNEIKTIWDAA